MSSFRGRIYDSLVDTVGATPMVRLSSLAAKHGCPAECLAKLEFFNPLASVKDRIGVAMIERARRDGTIKKDTVLVEPTSGNTGIALAFVCACRSIPLILTMPESMSLERRKMLTLLGAQLELTPAQQGMNGAIERAHTILRDNPHAVMLQQFDNPANPDIHATTTAEEIWHDCGGKLDYVVCGVGTGGTITGVGRKLKQYNPDIRMIAVEPENSPVLSGGLPGPHKIQGIGAGFVPKILDRTIIDAIMTINNENALNMARMVARCEGLPVGISSGAALAAALELGKQKGMQGKRIVTIIPSFAERYLSTDLFLT